VGIEMFLEPGCEVLVARNGADVAEHLRSLTQERARQIGEAARQRVLSEHTYAHRAAQLEALMLEHRSASATAQGMEVGA
jgi:spore maturation protein CgeB